MEKDQDWCSTFSPEQGGLSMGTIPWAVLSGLLRAAEEA